MPSFQTLNNFSSILFKKEKTEFLKITAQDWYIVSLLASSSKYSYPNLLVRNQIHQHFLSYEPC